MSANRIELLEEMVLFRSRNGSIPCFIYGTPKWFYIEDPEEPFFKSVEPLIEPFLLRLDTFITMLHLD